MRAFWDRIVGASLLEAETFEAIEADTGATFQAVAIVLLVSVAGGVGSIGQSGAGLAGIAVGAVAGLAAWVSWAVMTAVIGTRLLPEPQTRADTGQLLRVLAFAASPGLLQVAGIVPMLRAPAFIISFLWMVAAMTVAVRQALDYRTTGRAIAVCLLAWLLVVVAVLVVGALFPSSVLAPA